MFQMKSLCRNGLFLIALGGLGLSWSCDSPRQRADPEYVPKVASPHWSPETGPMVAVDAAHHNFHTIDGRYKSFADLLRADGYNVRSFDRLFTPTSLTEKVDILVISNALGEENAGSENWKLPVYPAFTDEEVQAVVDWIRGGGALLLIADHMPMGGAAAPLAAALGLEFTNTYAIRAAENTERGPLPFTLESGTLHDHPILRGTRPEEQVRQVTTFTGQAFRGEATPLLTFGPEMEAVYPEVFGQWDENTQRHSIEGWFQGAVLELGEGRVAVFGEAAMFSAQVSAKGRAMGMNAEIASENPQFLLNVMHWLSGEIN